jgi:hypothetical protein
MKLKHIFENQKWDTSRMSLQEIWDDLSDIFTIKHSDGPKRKVDIDIDPQGRISLFDAKLWSISSTLGSMPVELTVVNALTAKGLNTLTGLPKVCMNYLELLGFTGQDLTSATPVGLGGDTYTGRLHLVSCFELKTLDGIEKFTSRVQDREIEVIIENCPNLEFDPYNHINHAEIVFYDKIPRKVQLVNAIALSNAGHIRFEHLEDKKLEEIINKHRGKGHVFKIPLASELIKNGYGHHARPT